MATRNFKQEKRTRINEMINASTLRIIGPQGENFGEMSKSDAIAKAREFGSDLIEISPNANPPVAKIMDYGKFQYDQNKKQKAQKAKSHSVEVKGVQVKIGTDENDLSIKAKKASKWLTEGHRVKIELFLPGRSKYLEKVFLEERLKRLLKLLTTDFKIAEDIKKSARGIAMIIEKK